MRCPGEGLNHMHLRVQQLRMSSSVKLPMEPRSAALGAGGTHAGGSSGAVGGAPYGATKRCAGW
eukprot:7612239-Pyramimonas_sp.AAC.1